MSLVGRGAACFYAEILGLANSDGDVTCFIRGKMLLSCSTDRPRASACEEWWDCTEWMSKCWLSMAEDGVE